MVILDKELNSVSTPSFSEAYVDVLNHLVKDGSKVKSRGGDTRELLDYKINITDPYKRFVGGFGRGINPYFLIAEAIWIAAGKRDVAFLDIFNSRMKDFSDNGRVFHAPYGFRLRSWGIRSEDEHVVAPPMGLDQIATAIKLLDDNRDSRQVVLSIWNTEFDLGVNTKDIPCNDLIMLKIRDGKLVTTIANRSNDIHWGVPTNVFQFSFLTELIASCLGVELGTQTHNSQSLHVYDWNEVTGVMLSEENKNCVPLYLNGELETRIDFNFKHEVSSNRFREIDNALNTVISNVTLYSETGSWNEEEVLSLFEFSKYLWTCCHLLKIYIDAKSSVKTLGDNARLEAVKKVDTICRTTLSVLGYDNPEKSDLMVMCKAFYAARIKDKGLLTGELVKLSKF